MDLNEDFDENKKREVWPMKEKAVNVELPIRVGYVCGKPRFTD